MRIEQLALLRYGHFCDRSIALPPRAHDFHVIVGTNEAGKSTLRQAVIDLLFGIPRNTPLAFRHDMSELRLGAVLVNGPERLEFQRTKGNRQTLRDPRDRPLPEDVLAPFLGVTQRDFFIKMFGLDHPGLVEGGASLLSAADDIGQILFQSAAGIASLGRIRADFEDEADRLWGQRKSQARAYYQAAAQLEQASAELREATCRTREWSEAQAVLADAGAVQDQTRARHHQVRARRSLLERIRRVRPALIELDTLRERRGVLGEVPLLPEGAAQVLAEVGATLAREQDRIDQLSGQLERLHASLAVLVVDETLRGHAAAIRELHEQRLQYRDYPAELGQREAEVQGHARVVEEIAARLGWHGGLATIPARLPAAAQRARAERLSREHPVLSEAQRAAERAARLRRQELELAELALRELPPAPASSGLLAALAAAQRLGPVSQNLHGRRDEVRRWTLQLSLALAALEPAPLMASALDGVRVPEEGDVHALVQQAGQDEARAERVTQEQRALADALARARLAVTLHRQAHAPVSVAEVLDARTLRDATWQELRSGRASVDQHGPVFEEQMRRVDVLADRRHDTAQQAAELQGREAEVARLELQASMLGEEQAALTMAAQNRAERWRTLCQESGMPDVPLARAQRWLEAFHKAEAAASQLAEAQAGERDVQLRAEQARQGLVTALQAAGGAVDAPNVDALGLDALMLEAEAVLAMQSERKLQRQALGERIAEGRRSVAVLAEDHQQARQALDAWSERWQALMAELGRDPATTPTELLAFLAQLDRLDAALAAIEGIRSGRILPLRTALSAHADAARALARRIAPELAELEPGALVIELDARLAAAEHTQLERQRLSEAQAESARDLREAQSRRDIAQARLCPLAQQAGVEPEDIAALDAAIRRSDLARALDRGIAQQEHALRDGGDGRSVEVLRAESAAVDPAELLGELELLAGQEAALVGELEQRATATRLAEQAVAAISGSADAALAEARRQEALAAMTGVVERYLQVLAAARLLRWSIERFRDIRQGPMLAAASTIFAGLTLGGFERLVVDFEADPPRLLARRVGGGAVPVDGMSDGTRDQLFLALRLAALHMHLGDAPALPFIADDLFINYDDARARAGLLALAELSRHTQVLFLTHHDHLLPVMQEVFGETLNIVRLDRRAPAD